MTNNSAASPPGRNFTGRSLRRAVPLLCVLSLSGCSIDWPWGINHGEQLYLNYVAENLQQLDAIDFSGQVSQRPYDVDEYNTLPDFTSITHTPDRKRAFFDYMIPAVEFQNEVVEERRLVLDGIKLKLKYGMELSVSDVMFLGAMGERYRIDPNASLARAMVQLNQRMDIVPASMVLSQAAMESGWGTSRFAMQANNMFGQWCFSKGCGVVPGQRDGSARHEVAKYDRVDLAVESYFRNINTQASYTALRGIRQQARSEGRLATGHELVAGLSRYSARGDDYIDELRRMIRSNELE
jgi:Bax protein